jgi:very-short-patch-repair endonuclease
MSERAKALRANSSPVERRMWRLLHGFRTGGYHFRKQAPIGPYTVDMACHHAKLVIEIDGDTHGSDAARRNDARRDAFLCGEGYTVLRISNSEVMTNSDGVYQLVAQALDGKPKQPRVAHPLPNPPHKGEGVPPSLRQPPASTSPLVGEVAQPGASAPSEAGRGDRDV